VINMKNIIMDVDTGLDDAVAITFASLQENLKIAGITTVNGNRPVNQVVENTLRVVEALDKDIPVYKGSSLPLNAFKNRKEGFPYSEDVTTHMHGIYLNLPKTSLKVQKEMAISWMHEYLRVNSSTTIVAIGPLTNIAQLITIDPRVKEKIGNLVILGGGINLGNVTHFAEFNFWADPEAAKIVLNSGININLITLNEANLAVVDANKLEELLGKNTQRKESKILFNLMENSLSNSKGSVTLYDMLTIAYLAKEEIIQFEPMNLDVNVSIDDKDHDGELLFERCKSSNIMVSKYIDIEMLWAFMRESLNK